MTWNSFLIVADQATDIEDPTHVDPIIQTNWKLPVLIDQRREILAQKPYLNLPIKNGAPKRRMRILVDGKIERDFILPVADAEPDCWMFMDLLPFQGQTLHLEVEGIPEDSKALAAIEQSDCLKDADDLYREPLRPQFHFTTRRGWNNDPNGLVYCAGEWHLFYQHNPYSTQWDNMHWGHAVSPDLVHWQELPVALYPDALGPCFSGSAVVDEFNTAGFQTGDEKPIVCIYTAAGNPFTQCLAYSLDRGRTWAKYAGNPVLPHIVGTNRDPKVFWYAPQRRWIMALYLNAHDFGLFASPDLKSWEWLDTVTIPGTSECPEFFEIPVEGPSDQTRWIFYGGNGQYLIGQFDGQKFTPESGPHPLNHGNCFYASQTFNHTPDGRRILMAWGPMSMPDMPFNQMMDFPVELTLRPTPEGLRLFAVPVREIKKLHALRQVWQEEALDENRNLAANLAGELFDLRTTIELGSARQVGFVVRGLSLIYDVDLEVLSCGDRSAPLPMVNGAIRLQLLIDRTSLEIFGNAGQLYMPMGLIPDAEDRSLRALALNGRANLRSLEVYELLSIWQ